MDLQLILDLRQILLIELFEAQCGLCFAHNFIKGLLLGAFQLLGLTRTDEVPD